MFNKQNCIQRIYDISKERGIKIGDLEKNAGVSAGYLSRINKDGNTSTLSVDLLVSIADQLKVSVEMLILDMSGIGEGEQYISRFIDKLIQKTKTSSLEWQKQTLAEMRKYEYTDASYPLPFFDRCEGYKEFEGKTYDVEYVTRFYDEGNTFVNGACYWTTFGWESATVYITSITHTEDVYIDGMFPDVRSSDAYEVYIDNGKLIPLCNTQFLNEAVSQQVEALYEIITNTQSKIGVTAEVRKLIDNFMDDSLPFN